MMRFAGLATAFALTACALPPSEENERPERRRERAERHARLALAYLSHAYPGVARQEAAVALGLAPDDPQALHAAGLAELALGRLPAALPHLAAAARVVTGRPGWRDDARSGAILSNYATALCTAGRVDDARQWWERARETPAPDGMPRDRAAGTAWRRCDAQANGKARVSDTSPRGWRTDTRDGFRMPPLP